MNEERWATFWLGVAVVCMIALWLFISSIRPSFAQEHQHPPQDEAIHEKFYNTWMMPDQPTVSCCHKRDCYPTEARRVGPRWEAKRREDGQWLVVPDEKIERNRDNPDGRNHLCAPPPHYGDRVYCFSLGGGT